MEKQEILAICREEKIRFLRLQFIDILGANKNVEIPENQFEKALEGQVLFDGSSIEGFVRIEESDMLLKPDFDTFRIFPWEDTEGKIGRLICDVYNPDETPFLGCPRLILKKVTGRAKKLGYTMVAGPEVEFFLFQKDANGNATVNTHDSGGYFDLMPIDKGEEARRAIVNALESMGFKVEAAHHEVAPGQHEIDFQYEEAVTAADNIGTFKLVVRKVAMDFGLHATFMPKPIVGVNGSGMHTHQSLFKNGENVFHDPRAKYQLSDIAKWYIGGLLRHAKGMCAITNPLINSYKRLVPGYEAPTNIAWSERNRSPLARVPDRRGVAARVELRMPDPSCNPYLALAVMLQSGLDGIENKIDPGPPVNKNIFEMSHREKRRLKIDELPPNLYEALKQLNKDDVIKEILGNQILTYFVKAKMAAWEQYNLEVHQWEIERYLTRY